MSTTTLLLTSNKPGTDGTDGRGAASWPGMGLLLQDLSETRVGVSETRRGVSETRRGVSETRRGVLPVNMDVDKIYKQISNIQNIQKIHYGNLIYHKIKNRAFRIFENVENIIIFSIYFRIFENALLYFWCVCIIN